MSTIRIHAKNAAYQKLEVLKANRNKRHRYGEFLVEGVRNINQAIKHGWEIRAFVHSDPTMLSAWAASCLRDVRTRSDLQLSNELMREISGKTDTSELLAVVAMPQPRILDVSRLSCNPLVALFDRPSNRGNLGTVLRSCDAMGVEQLILTGHCVDLFDPETVQASMGSMFCVPTAYADDNACVDDLLSRLTQHCMPNRLTVIGTSAHAASDLYDCDLTGPTVLMLGNEADGLCQYLRGICNTMARIPMHPNSNATSLNVACAATLLFSEAFRQRRVQKHQSARG